MESRGHKFNRGGVMAVYLDEFLYRGNPDGAEGTFHVVLGSQSTDAFGTTQTSLSQALTPEEALAQGFGLPAIVAAINTGLAAENVSLKAQVLALQSGIPVVAPTIAAPAISNYTQLTELFTSDELTAIAASTDPAVTRISRMMISVADMDGVTAADPRFIDWINYLDDTGLLTQLRATLVRALIPPQLI